MLQVFAWLVRLEKDEECYRCHATLQAGGFALQVAGKNTYHCHLGVHKNALTKQEGSSHDKESSKSPPAKTPNTGTKNRAG